MWSWVTSAVKKAGSWIKGAVETVKKASDVINTVNSGAESTIAKVNAVRNGSVSSWKDDYNKVTENLQNTIN